MKARGFSKSGRDFHRRVGDAWQVVNVQASQGNFGSSGKFTVNLGVYLPAVSVLAGAPEPAGKPKEYQCTVRERAGALMTGGIDHWWELSEAASSEAVAREMAAAVEQFGLPWLEAQCDVRRMSETLRSQPSILSAAAALAAGDKQEAEQRVVRMVSDRPAVATAALAWARKHGLTVTIQEA